MSSRLKRRSKIEHPIYKLKEDKPHQGRTEVENSIKLDPVEDVAMHKTIPKLLANIDLY
jgi:hypothetical protein